MLQLVSRRFSSAVTRDDVFICGAYRTPIGSFNGTLKSLSGPQLGSMAIKGLLDKTGTDPSVVNEVYMGNVCQAGQGQAPARQAALGAGLSVHTPCSTIHKVCASGMKSVILATQSLKLNDQSVMIAGGFESMSNSPLLVNRNIPFYGGFTAQDSILKDGLTDAYKGIHMGICAEKTAKDLNITREEQDEFAKLSYTRSSKSNELGILAKEIIPVSVPCRGGTSTLVSEDEEFRRADFKKFSSLKPAFLKTDGTITAGNASTLNDGGCAILLANSTGLKKGDMEPLARIVGYADAAINPVDFGVAPASAVAKLLKMTGKQISDISLWEINEAFSCVALANVKLLKLDILCVNVHGGAVSLGHPIGMSGARIITHLVHNLETGQLGVAAICNGGGGASTVLIEKL